MGLNSRIMITDNSRDSLEVYVSPARSALYLSTSTRGIVALTPADARELAEYLNARADEIEAGMEIAS